MSVSSRKITVVVDGTSLELQKAVTKAADSLKMLGKITADQSKLAIGWGEKVITSNAAVAKSYGDVAAAAARSGAELDTAIRSQAAAQGDLATSARVTSEQVVASAERQGAAYRDAAVVVDESSNAQSAAITRVGAAATRTSTEIAAAAGRQVAAVRGATDATAAASTRANAVVRDGAAKNAAGFAASGSGLVKLGKTALVTASAVAAGSLYMSAKFEASTTRILTQAGATEAQVKQMRSAILDMAGSLGQTPAALSEGLYHIVSSMNKVLPAATRTTEELRIMRIAAEGAAIGGTSMQETTYALASAMNALHQNAGSAEHTMALLNAVVGSGDMNMHDLLEALKSGLIPTARTFGVSLQSVGAALAVMGDQGMRGALAGTRLRMALSLIAAPSEKSAKVLSALGMSAGEVHARTKAMSDALSAAGLTTTTMAADLRKPDGITVALRDLWDHLKKAGLSATEISDVFGRAFGGGRMSATTELLAQSVGRVGVKYKQVGDQIGQFGNDWKKTHETLTFQAHAALAAVEALGVKIGKDLTPAAKTALHDLEEVAKWLEHNKGAAEALAGVITGVLGVAIAAFVANRLAKMVEGLKQVGAASQWLRSGFGATAATSTATRASTTAGLPGLSEGGMFIGGSASGYGLPGSPTNPIVVAMESGDVAGLGGRSAAVSATGATASEARAAESRSPGGVLLPPGATAREADAAAAKARVSNYVPTATPTAPLVAPSTAGEEAKLSSSFRKVAGTAIDGVMKGGMVALAGTFVSQLVGAQVGGKKGHEITTIGDTAALGAAIGTVIEPGVGTAIGAGLGGIAGAIKALVPSASAQHTSPLFHGHGMPDLTGTKQYKEAEEEYNKEQAELAKLTGKPSTRVKHHGFAARQSPTAAEAQRRRDIENYYEEQKGAKLGAAQQESVLKGRTIPSINSIVRTSEVELGKLKPVGRAGMVGFIESMVTTLEKEGRVPKHSLEHIFTSLRPLLTNVFPKLASDSAKDFSAQFAQNLKAEGAEKKLTDVTTRISKRWAEQWHLLPVTAHMGLAEAQTTTDHDLGVLQYQMQHGSRKARELAAAEYATLAPTLKHYLTAAKGAVFGELTTLSHGIGPLASKGTQAFLSVYASLPPGVKAYLDTTGGNVGKGIDKINKMLVDELQGLGISGKQIKGFIGNSTEALLSATTHPGNAENLIHQAEGRARGGLIQLGRPGQRGRDSIPMSVGGTNIVAAPGEQVAVFNHEQQEVANARFADIGGLPGLFQKHNRPHHMAKGGIVRGPVSTFGPPGEAAGGTAYGGSSAQPGIAVNPHGGSNWNDALARSFAHMVARVTVAGHSANLRVIDKGPSAVGSHGPRVIDITGAGVSAMGLSPASFPTDAIGEANFGGGSLVAAIGSAAAGIVKKILEPKLGGSGAVGAIGQAVVHKATIAANHLLQREAAKKASAAPSGEGGAAGALGPAPTGGGFSPAQLGSFDGTPVAKWIVPELAWARAHGWPGHVTSGYRSPNEVVHGVFATAPQGQSEHRLDIYPGGAVDVSDYETFAKVIRGYPGAQKLRQLGIDPLHFSGTGHARGGLIHATNGTNFTATVASKKKHSSHKAIPKGHGRHPNHHPLTKATLAQALAPLSLIPDTENLPPAFGRAEKKVKADDAQASILQQLESAGKQNTFILPGDMAYIGSMAKYANVQPGMTTAASLLLNEKAQTTIKLAAKGKPNVHQEEEQEALAYQREFIEWAAQQASHRKLTASDMGILAGVSGLAGWSPHAGQNLWEAEFDNIQLQIANLLAEERAAKHGESAVGLAIEERKKRETLVDAVARKEKYRLDLTEGHIEGLTTGSLKQRISHAKSKSEYDARVEAAHQSAAQIQESIDHEHEAAKPDKKLLIHLEAHKRNVLSSVHAGKPSSGSVQAAQVKLLEHELKGEVHPIEEALTKLGGKAKQVSHSGGFYKQLVDDIKKLKKSGSDVFATAIETIKSSDMPTAMLSERSILEASQDSPVPIFVPGVHSAEEGGNSALDALLKEQLQQANERANLAGIELGTLKNFIPQMPHYEKGGPVLEDGPIYAHKGEHVVPKEGTLVASGGGGRPNVSIETTHVFQGELAPLMRLVDERVQHPDNVRVVSQQVARRTQALPGFRSR